MTEGIVLKTHRIGEIHKGVTFHSPSKGVASGIAHGAYRTKSRIAGTTDPFSRARFYLYEEPVKGSCKINDAELLDGYHGVRDSLIKYYVASLWAEVIIKSHGGGAEDASVFQLLAGGLSALDRVPETGTDDLLIQFLWRYLSAIGFGSGLDRCAACARKIRVEERIYVSRGPGLVCDSCAGGIPVGSLAPGARRYLAYAERASFDAAARVRLEPGTVGEAKAAILTLVQNVIEGPLNTLRSAGGLL